MVVECWLSVVVGCWLSVVVKCGCLWWLSVVVCGGLLCRIGYGGWLCGISVAFVKYFCLV